MPRGTDVMWQYLVGAVGRAQEIILGEVRFKLKLEMSLEVDQGRREEKSTPRRRGKACAKALR